MSIHGGNIRELADSLSCGEDEIIDFSANINPLGFPPWLREEVSRNISSLTRYPDRNQKNFIQAVSNYHGINKKLILGGNGAGELIDLIPRAVNPDYVIIPVPSYTEYVRSCREFRIEEILLKAENSFQLDTDTLSRRLLNKPGKKLVFIGQPNNPTGTLTDSDLIISLAKKHRNTFFCIDESFADFLSDYSSPVKKIIKENLENLIIIRSMTKFYAIPGLRLGYCVSSQSFIEKLKNIQPPWSVNTLALNVGERALQDERYRINTIRNTEKLRIDFLKNLQQFRWLKIFPPGGNFILIKILNDTLDIKVLSSFLLNKHIAVRNCSSFQGLDSSYFRIAVRTEKENRILLEALKEFEQNTYLYQIQHRKKDHNSNKNSKTPALMIQGTSSNAGKSIITAGLCRIFYQEGIKVTPFKAQNMSLNSAVTPGGLEIGRAQALQARAAGITPDVRMNPLLLKPTHEKGSEIILSGLPSGFITSGNWKEAKIKAEKTVKESYTSLSSEYDAVILEGAGSPGEINLKDGDIVNMKMAGYAGAPVIIVGDIDRGGVYAAFIGTMEVFEEWERNLVKGFIVNKFRGDPDLLDSAHEYLLHRTGIPVVGTVPYMKDIKLPEEDSVSFKELISSVLSGSEKSDLSIGVIDLPSISNFTDIDPLNQESEVYVKIIRDAAGITEDLDAVIIPGSKNVIKDMDFLKSRGFASILKTVVSKRDVNIIGICGGFQMLGEKITDPNHVEAEETSAPGLKLLGIETTFYRTKRLKEVKAVHHPSGLSVKGYEIHHGISRITNAELILGDKEHLLGASSPDGTVWGTYLHGIFDDNDFRRWFLNSLREKKGLDKKNSVTRSYDLDSELDNLAEILKTHIDIGYLKRLMGI